MKIAPISSHTLKPYLKKGNSINFQAKVKMDEKEIDKTINYFGYLPEQQNALKCGLDAIKSSIENIPKDDTYSINLFADKLGVNLNVKKEFSQENTIEQYIPLMKKISEPNKKPEYQGLEANEIYKFLHPHIKELQKPVITFKNMDIADKNMQEYMKKAAKVIEDEAMDKETKLPKTPVEKECKEYTISYSKDNHSTKRIMITDKDNDSIMLNDFSLENSKDNELKIRNFVQKSTDWSEFKKQTESKKVQLDDSIREWYKKNYNSKERISEVANCIETYGTYGKKYTIEKHLTTKKDGYGAFEEIAVKDGDYLISFDGQVYDKNPKILINRLRLHFLADKDNKNNTAFFEGEDEFINDKGLSAKEQIAISDNIINLINELDKSSFKKPIYTYYRDMDDNILIAISDSGKNSKMTTINKGSYESTNSYPFKKLYQNFIKNSTKADSQK